MKKITFILSAFIFFRANAQEPIDSKQREIVIQAVNIIPMDYEHVLENQDIVIKDGVISDMGPSGRVRYSKKAFVISAKGKFLIPGLNEMHAHIPQTEELEPMLEVMTLFAANGITTVRSMLGHIKHLELRAKIETAEIIAPTLYTSGPSFNGKTATTPQVTTEMVQEQFSMGYDFLKIHPGVPLASFYALVKAANKEKIPFAGHVPAEVGIWRAIESDYRSIDHLDGMIEGLIPNVQKIPEEQIGLFGVYGAGKADLTLLPKMMKGLAAHHVWVVPTEALAERWLAFDKSSKELAESPEMKYVDEATTTKWIEAHEDILKHSTADGFKKFIDLRKKLILECKNNDVGVLLGSDAPQVFNVPGFSAHRELQYYVNAGLPPYEALLTGTAKPAAYFDRPNCGMIMTGSIADLVLLNGNPLENIKNTQNVEGVMMHTHWLSKEYLDNELKKLVKK